MHSGPCVSPSSPPIARPHTAVSRSSDPRHRDGHTCLSGLPELGNLGTERGREGEREGGREGGRERGREGEREGGREGYYKRGRGQGREVGRGGRRE